MDFLLECIGFPPDYDLDALTERVRAQGQPMAWRGPSGTHLHYQLAGGLEVRVEREEGEEHWSIWPHYRVDRRLRVALLESRRVPDSPFDAQLVGVANPMLPERLTDGEPERDPELDPGEYLLSTWVTDARRLPRNLRRGHVLALSIAGFALDVSFVGPNDEVRDPAFLESPQGAHFAPLGGVDDPGGCMDVSLRVRQVRHIENPLTGVQVEVIEVDAPGRPLELFVSRWQLEAEGMDLPRPGWRIEGAFLFSGRIAGGLPRRPR